MGILDAPSLSRVQADARYTKITNYVPERFDGRRIATLPPIYNGGDVTLTLSAAGAVTSIASPVSVPGNDPSVRFSGSRLDGPILVSGATPYYTGGNLTGSSLDGGMPYYADWCIDSADYEIKFFTGAANRSYKIWIDGKPMSLTSTALATTGSIYRLRVQLASRRPHHVRVLTSAGMAGFVIGPNDTMWLPTFSIWKKRIYFLGDSFTVGANATLSTDGYQYTVAELLGWEPLSGGEAGTGYSNPGSGGGRDTFLNRIATDVVPQNPEGVVIYGGTNDSATGLQAAATATYAALASGLPNVPVYVFGCQYPSGAADATRDTKDAAIAAAAAAASNVKRFTSVKTWFTGTGKVGATTGSGNSDLYTSSDGLHPSTAGHYYIGPRMSQSIALPL